MNLMDVASLFIAAVSLIVAFAALVVAVIALRRADKNASAANLVTLNDGFRNAWKRYVDALKAEDSDEQDYEFAELLNLFEIACALHQDGSFHGAAKELIETYLCDTLSLIAGSTEAYGRMLAVRDAPATFKWLRAFLRQMARSGRVPKITERFESLTQ